MTSTLVSFLGRARQAPKTGYRPATYRFPDGSQQTTPFFGLALRCVLAPNRLVLLGTGGSGRAASDLDLDVFGVGTMAEDTHLQLRTWPEPRSPAAKT